MKKLLVLLIGLCLCCGVVSAADCYGFDYKFINGEKHIYNVTVVVVDDAFDYYHYNHVIYEDATVVIGTDASVTVEGVESPNGLPFHFSTGNIEFDHPHFTNKVVSGEKLPEPVKVVTSYDIMKDIMVKFNHAGFPQSITLCGIEFTYTGESQYHSYEGNGYKIELWVPLVVEDLVDPQYNVYTAGGEEDFNSDLDALKKFDDAEQLYMLSAYETIVVTTSNPVVKANSEIVVDEPVELPLLDLIL